MRRRRSVVWLCAWSVAVVVIGVHTGVAAYATHAQRSAGSAIHRAIIGPACSRWLAYSVPDYTTQTNANLQSIAAVPNSSQLWAVGWYGDPKSGNRQTLIEHYDGTHWSLVPSPNVASVNNYLVGVTAISMTDAVAVGYTQQSGVSDQTLIEQWNGTSWSLVSSPNVISTDNMINAVAAVSAGNVWAVGGYYDTTLVRWQTLIMQWNGSAWGIVPSPNVSIIGPTAHTGPRGGVHGDNVLQGVTAVAANDLWAVGRNASFTLTEHWNGTSWNIVPSVDVPNNSDQLTSVAAVSSTDVMSVGYASGGGSTLAEHWDGTQWSIVSTNHVGTLLSVAAIPGTHEYVTAGTAGDGPSVTLVEQWNGTVWTLMPTSNPATTNQLWGITATSALRIIATGLYTPASSVEQPLVEQYVPKAVGTVCTT